MLYGSKLVMLLLYFKILVPITGFGMSDEIVFALVHWLAIRLKPGGILIV